MRCRSWIEIRIEKPPAIALSATLAEDPLPNYSKRPPAADPLALDTGDFEAVNYGGPVSKPRAPIFHRSMPTVGHTRELEVPRAQANYPMRYVPMAPNSLSPLSMSAVAAGTHLPHPPPTAASKSMAMLGIPLLLGGAILGGVLGVATRARPDLGASLAVQVPDEAPASLDVTPPPPPAVTLPQGPTTTPPTYEGIVIDPTDAVIVVKDTKDTKKPATHVSTRPAGAPPPATAKVTPPKEKKDRDDGYRVASAGEDAREMAKPKESVKEAPKDAKKVDKSAKNAAAAKNTGSDDAANAANILQAAKGATENTL